MSSWKIEGTDWDNNTDDLEPSKVKSWKWRPRPQLWPIMSDYVNDHLRWILPYFGDQPNLRSPVHSYGRCDLTINYHNKIKLQSITTTLPKLWSIRLHQESAPTHHQLRRFGFCSHSPSETKYCKATCLHDWKIHRIHWLGMHILFETVT